MGRALCCFGLQSQLKNALFVMSQRAAHTSHVLILPFEGHLDDHRISLPCTLKLEMWLAGLSNVFVYSLAN